MNNPKEDQCPERLKSAAKMAVGFAVEELRSCGAGLHKDLDAVVAIEITVREAGEPTKLFFNSKHTISLTCLVREDTTPDVG